MSAMHHGPSASSVRTSSRILLAVAGLSLAACGGGGGGGGGDGPTGSAAAGGDLIIGAPGGRDASELDTDELLRQAADGAARGFNVNLGNLARFESDDDFSAGSAPPGAAPLGGAMDEELIDDVESASETLSARLFGVDDPNARVVREGNVITVDPDDASLCSADETGILGADVETVDDGRDPVDASLNCRRLVADLTVRLDARSEDSGIITYLFAGVPVIALGYSPGGASSELYLDGVQGVIERIDAIDREDAALAGDEEAAAGLPRLRGALRLDARVFDEREGSAEIELRVTEALEIGADGPETGLSLAPSRVFLLGVDEASGEGRLSVAWGALRVIAESGDSDGNSELTTFDLGGLTLETSVTEGAPTLSVANVGIGGVPLTVRVGSNDALSLALETFGVTLDRENEVLVFDTDAGIDLMLDNLGDLLAERTRAYTGRFVADLPQGTALEEVGVDGASAIRVNRGGPLSASLLETDDSRSAESAISVGAGGCFELVTPEGDAVGLAGPVDVFEEPEPGPFDGLSPESVACP